MSVKNRRYNDSYTEHGFTCIINNGEERPQCVICNKVDASYYLALEIARQKKPHTIGKNLIKTCSLKIVELMLGNEEKKKIAAVLLSNSTIQRRIEDMAADIRDQVEQEIKSAAFGLFSIQLNESTDVTSCCQIVVFVKYVHLNDFKEELLFCSRLEKTTKAIDIFKKVFSFFESENLLWENLCGCLHRRSPSYVWNQISISSLCQKAKSKHKRHSLYNSSPCAGLQNASSSIT